MQRNKTFSGLAVIFIIEFCLGVGWVRADRDELPKALIIGDSISIGYTDQVAELLKEKADVVRRDTKTAG